MEVRKEKTADFYKTIVEWWNGHSIEFEGKTISYPIIPQPILPEYLFVLSENNKDLYCIFAYATDSSLLFIAYPTRNPKYKNKKGALEFLLNEVEKYAREQNYFLMFTTSPVKPVQEALLGVGFVEGDENVTQFYKQLPPEN